MSRTTVPAVRRRRIEPLPPLKAKLSRPDAGEFQLERPRLIQALNANAARRLTLVVADAGYGKTSLVAAFTRLLLRPVVWYSLMPSDADPIVFGRYLLEGFRQDSPRFGRDFERALEDARPGTRATEMLAGTLANEWAALRGPTRLLVLDDFQEVSSNRAVLAFVETLLRCLPPTIRMLLVSRSNPPLGLERLRSGGELFELDSSQLRFTSDELSRLFAEVYRRPLTDAERSALEATTLGWPTAVHLVHEQLMRSESVRLEDVLADIRSSSLAMHDYLSSEVYSRLEPDARHLLDRTAALQRFDVPLAATLASQRDVEPLLNALASRGLLRAFGHGAQTSFECHDLVRRFVRQKLEARCGANGWRELEGETAAALADRGERERALRHWLAAGRDDEASRMLRELAPGLLRQGRAAALRSYLNDLPAALVREHAELQLLLADSHQALGDWDAAEPLYQEILERPRASLGREIECRVLLGLGKVLNLRGRHEQVLGMAERGLVSAQKLGPTVRARLLQMKAGAHFYLGQYQAAVDLLDQVRGLLTAMPDPELLLPTIHNLAGAYAAQGKFREATAEFRVALAQVRGTTSPRAPLYLSNLAFHLAELGDLGEARRAAEEGLAAAQRFSNRAQECICHQALAQALAQSGDLDGALAALRSAEELNGDLRIEVIEADLLLLHGRVFLARGQYRRAVEFVNQAIERLEQRPDDPRLVEARSALAWCELRAGRLQVARGLLAPLAGAADCGENDYLRMRVHYWLGEALLALGEKRAADAHVRLALRLVRERGYLYFLKVQAREDSALPLHALARGIEPDIAAAALVEAGGEVEASLLAMLDQVAPAAGETVLAVLAEVGGPASSARLPRVARERRALQPGIRSALRHIHDRGARGAPAERGSAATAVRLVLYGPPHLKLDSRALPASAWRTQRALQMLVYFALHPRGADRDRLIDCFWPGRQAAAGRRNLHPTLSYIRSVLPRTSVAPILRDGERYRLNPAYPITCDAWDAERACEESRNGGEIGARRAALERAVALAGERPLEGLYADWAREFQARDRDRLLRTLLELGDLCLASGDHEDALGHFRKALELDAFCEGTCIAVVRCLVRLGNRRAAMVEYERLRTLLRKELDVEPLPETEAAARQLLSGEGEPFDPDDELPPPTPIHVAQRVAGSAQVRLKGVGGGFPR